MSVEVDTEALPISSIEVVVTSDGGAQRSFFLNPPSQPASGDTEIWTASTLIGSEATYNNLYVLEFFIVGGEDDELISNEAIVLVANGRHQVSD